MYLKIKLKEKLLITKSLASFMFIKFFFVNVCLHFSALTMYQKSFENNHFGVKIHRISIDILSNTFYKCHNTNGWSLVTISWWNIGYTRFCWLHIRKFRHKLVFVSNEGSVSLFMEQVQACIYYLVFIEKIQG